MSDIWPLLTATKSGSCRPLPLFDTEPPVSVGPTHKGRGGRETHLQRAPHHASVAAAVSMTGPG
jgi:hypothetical protein